MICPLSVQNMIPKLLFIMFTPLVQQWKAAEKLFIRVCSPQDSEQEALKTLSENSQLTVASQGSKSLSSTAVSPLCTVGMPRILCCHAQKSLLPD